MFAKPHEEFMPTIKAVSKVCVFDLVHVFSDNLSLHFYDQSEMNESGLYKIKDTDF